MNDTRCRVFCASLADVFDNEVDPAWRAELFAVIAGTPNLDWLLLTKRIGNVPAMLEAPGMQKAGLPDNVWLGATIVNQAEADRDIPKLLAVPARVRFLSMEPLLAPVTLPRFCACGCNKPLVQAVFEAMDGPSALNRYQAEAEIRTTLGIDWVIAGGESGHGARPMHPQWARALRDQCAAAGVPFLFKQHGEWAPGSGDFGSGRFQTASIALDGRVVEGGYGQDGYPAGATSVDGWSMVHRAGKKAAGRLLDGCTHNEFPATATYKD